MVQSLFVCTIGSATRAARSQWPSYTCRWASGMTPTARLSALKMMMKQGRMVRAMEAHSGLTALVVDNAKAERPDGTIATFDAIWSSSLTSSAIKGKPDIETVSTAERIDIVQDILEVSDKPVIYDGDTGGSKEIFHFTVRSLERLGVSACIIEDKSGLKQNSLFGTDRKQVLEDVDVFCDKIRVGKQAQATSDFMIIARLEALIAGLGEQEALDRAKAYVEKGGCDGIMIHSKEKKPDEILSFIKNFRAKDTKTPIVVVPTTYNISTEDELYDAGAQICIYANQLLRAAYPAMQSVAQSILMHGRSKEVDDVIMPVKQILTLIDDNTGSK